MDLSHKANNIQGQQDKCIHNSKLKGMPISNLNLYLQNNAEINSRVLQHNLESLLQEGHEHHRKCKRRAMRHITNTYSPYVLAADLIKNIGHETSETQRKKNKLNLLHKIYNNGSSLKMLQTIRTVNR